MKEAPAQADIQYGHPMRWELNSVLKDHMGEFSFMPEHEFDLYLDTFFRARELIEKLENQDGAGLKGTREQVRELIEALK
jgi:hypothetical protein